jgi:hypothetical protein
VRQPSKPCFSEVDHRTNAAAQSFSLHIETGQFQLRIGEAIGPKLILETTHDTAPASAYPIGIHRFVVTAEAGIGVHVGAGLFAR